MSQPVLPAPDPMKAFEASVVEKLRGDIGTIIPDDVLAALVQKTVKETFFTPSMVRNPKRGQWNEPDNIPGPSWFQTALAEAAKPLLDAAVANVVKEQREMIDATIAAEVERDKIMLAVTASVAQESGRVMAAAIAELFQAFRNQGIIR